MSRKPRYRHVMLDTQASEIRPTPRQLVTPPHALSGAVLMVVTIAVALGWWTACPARAGVIVSVGDSYSSGEGSAPYDQKTDVKAVNTSAIAAPWAGRG